MNLNRIQHLIEPRRLLLAWQRPMAGMERRTRHIVGEIERSAGGVVFRYLVNARDFELARTEGFQGYPAFALTKGTEFSTGVLDAFMRRLPPRKREDFTEYLAQHHLPDDFAGSDIALLAYTGARLPGDGFEVVPDLQGVTPPMELVLEVAGFRHQGITVDRIAAGDTVELVSEPDNDFDPKAVAVMHGQGRIGYVPRPYCDVMGEWLSTYSVSGRIDRINGKPERPVVYLFVTVS